MSNFVFIIQLFSANQGLLTKVHKFVFPVQIISFYRGDYAQLLKNTGSLRCCWLMWINRKIISRGFLQGISAICVSGFVA